MKQTHHLLIYVTHSSNQVALSSKLNPKFLNSMLKLIDKYNIPLNKLLPNNEKKSNSLNEVTNENDQKNNQEQTKPSYIKFSKDEDEVLAKTVSIFGAKNWRLIFTMIPNKNPRQCRDRYMNYLQPGFIHSEWTNEEDKLL